jgi:hypothetical protein
MGYMIMVFWDTMILYFGKWEPNLRRYQLLPFACQRSAAVYSQILAPIHQTTRRYISEI